MGKKWRNTGGTKAAYMLTKRTELIYSRKNGVVSRTGGGKKLMKLIGYNLREGNYNGKEYSGFDLYFSYKNESITGLGISKGYISRKNCLQDLDRLLGKEVEVLYNRFGKVQELRVLE